MRRRRTRYTWFPVIGGDTAENGEGFDLSTVTRAGIVAKDGSATLDVIPLIPDQARDSTTTATTNLVDFIGTSWLIKRLVGKLHIGYQQVDTTPNSAAVIPISALIVAGFFVARQDAGQPSNPIGDDTDFNGDYSPLALSTQREPWIWRRSWILSNRVAAASSGQVFWPESNSFYGSVGDGPHIDAKTARRSNNDERLWFAIGARAWPPNGGSVDADTDGNFLYTLDLRVLGTVRKQKNRSAF